MAKKTKTIEPVNSPYRPGAIGALLDLYEQALSGLKTTIAGLKNEQFSVSRPTSNGESYSVKNIMGHLLKSGYGYSNRIRKVFGMKTTRAKPVINTVADAVAELDKMFQYAVDSCKDNMNMDIGEMWGTKIKTGWTTYDLESLLEHALVHIMRHRLQIEKMLDKK